MMIEFTYRPDVFAYAVFNGTSGSKAVQNALYGKDINGLVGDAWASPHVQALLSYLLQVRGWWHTRSPLMVANRLM